MNKRKTRWGLSNTNEWRGKKNRRTAGQGIHVHRDYRGENEVGVKQGEAEECKAGSERGNYSKEHETHWAHAKRD